MRQPAQRSRYSAASSRRLAASGSRDNLPHRLAPVRPAKRGAAPDRSALSAERPVRGVGDVRIALAVEQSLEPLGRRCVEDRGTSELLQRPCRGQPHAPGVVIERGHARRQRLEAFKAAERARGFCADCRLWIVGSVAQGLEGPVWERVQAGESVRRGVANLPQRVAKPSDQRADRPAIAEPDQRLDGNHALVVVAPVDRA